MRVPLNASTFEEEEIAAAIEVLRSGRVTMGERCLTFEKAFADYIGIDDALFVNSGSSANLLTFFGLCTYAALERNGKRAFAPGAEVIVPAVTWSTTVWPIVQAGLIPVLVDTDPETLQMDVSAVGRALSDKTVAICVVHVLGNTVDMNPILELAETNGLWVIEDTCEALGARYRGQLTGTFGDVGTFSFFFSHHITTIEGGMVVTRHPELGELLRSMRAHGWTRGLKNSAELEAQHPDIDPRFLIVNTGFNLRPTEINAAFGIPQLRKLEGFNCRREAIVSFWNSRLQPLIRQGLLAPMRATEGARPAWFGYAVVCKSPQVCAALRQILERNSIDSRPIICGNMARQPGFRNVPHRIAGELSGADRIMDCGRLWGSHPLMTDEDIEYVAQSVLQLTGEL